MKTKIAGILGLFLLVVSLLIVPDANAYTVKYKGLWVNTAHTGLHAIISTGMANGSPPNFSFSALSPDTPDQDWYFTGVPAYSCVMAGTEFYRKSVNHGGSGATSRTFFVSNTCTGSYVYQISLSDTTFRSKYVHLYTFNDTGASFVDEGYDIRITKTSATPTWSIYLYNHISGVYDFITSVNGSNGSSLGSFQFIDAGGTQQDSGAYCPTLYPYQILEMRGLQYLNASSVWTALTNSDISYFNDTEMCFTANQYQITTPTPYKWRMQTYGVSW